MKVKIQEYIKNEKYYIIKTNKVNQYLGMNYDAFNNKITLQNFGPSESESGYLKPDTQRKMELKLTEIDLLLKTITILWNAVKKDSPVSQKIYNKSFNIRNFGDYEVNVQIKKDIMDFKYISIEKINKVDLPYESFSIYLDYVSSKTLYSVLKQLSKNRTVEIIETNIEMEDICYA